MKSCFYFDCEKYTFCAWRHFRKPIKEICIPDHKTINAVLSLFYTHTNCLHIYPRRNIKRDKYSELQMHPDLHTEISSRETENHIYSVVCYEQPSMDTSTRINLILTHM